MTDSDMLRRNYPRATLRSPFHRPFHVGFELLPGGAKRKSTAIAFPSPFRLVDQAESGRLLAPLAEHGRRPGLGERNPIADDVTLIVEVAARNFDSPGWR